MRKIKPFSKLKSLFFPMRPISNVFGFDRGTPIDRYYIDEFLEENAILVKGNVLEIGDNTYTKKYGGNKVSNSQVLHFTAENSKADIIGDLETGKGIPENYFDCFIMTQTLPFIFDFNSACKNAVKALKKDGVLIITVPGITQISKYDYDRWGHFWSFTDLSIKRIFTQFIPENQITIKTYGNVKSTAMFLYGFALRDVSKKYLKHKDSNYQLLITAIIKK